MLPSVRVKLCGLRTEQDVLAAAEARAAYIGFNFFPASPRSVNHEQAATLAALVPPGLCKVALVVDMSDAELSALLEKVPLDMLQLHGRETPERVAEIKALSGLPAMKALGVAGPQDVERIAAYEEVADQILVDAKPAPEAALPGGNGVAFDWRLIAGRSWPTPWMLAGGLTVENVGDAVRLTGARQVDVASGIESAPGHKDPTLMRDFVTAAQ